MKKLMVLLIVAFAVSGVYAAQKPKISMKKAKAIALKKVPGGKIESAEFRQKLAEAVAGALR